jgi:hypothetical protein
MELEDTFLIQLELLTKSHGQAVALKIMICLSRKGSTAWTDVAKAKTRRRYHLDLPTAKSLSLSTAKSLSFSENVLQIPSPLSRTTAWKDLSKDASKDASKDLEIAEAKAHLSETEHLHGEAYRSSISAAS